MASMTDTNVAAPQAGFLARLKAVLAGLAQGRAATDAARHLTLKDAERRGEETRALYLKHFG